jgi:signal transduction histidine kinase
MSFRSYGRQDGLQSHEFNAGAFFKNKAGEMFFGGVYGLNHFHPDSLQDNPTLPSVVLTGFKKFDMPARLEIEPDEIREIVLQADEAVFSLLYAGLEFTNPAGNQYAYRLEGFEDSWIRAGSRREVRYTSLPPGDYTFRVKASNSDGVWNNNGLAVHIVIVPPFWHSWWFLSLGGVTVLGGVVGTIRFLELRRIRQKITRLEKEEAVQRERIRISRDMHDELGASLTRIGLLAGIAGSPGRKVEEIRGHLQKIEETSRDVVQRLDEVVWMVNPKNDTVESLAAYVAEYAEHFFIESPIRCRFDYPTTVPALPVAAEVRRNVFLAIKEALNNIMKHSAAQVATLELHLDGGKVQFVVRDDGKGFTLPAGGSLGNGVGNMRSRIEEVRGEYILTSAPGRGTSIVISLQLPTP